MNEIEHVFPLPDWEQHKLDEAKEEIVHPVARWVRRGLAENAWRAIAISMAAGLACGLVWGRRG
jgi:O-succinylbenzoate synthase